MAPSSSHRSMRCPGDAAPSFVSPSPGTPAAGSGAAADVFHSRARSVGPFQRDIAHVEARQRVSVVCVQHRPEVPPRGRQIAAHQCHFSQAHQRTVLLLIDFVGTVQVRLRRVEI